MDQKDIEEYFKDEGRIILNTLIWHCQLATYDGYLIFNIDKLEVELCDITKKNFHLKSKSTPRIVPNNIGEIFIVDGVKYDIHLHIKSLENLKFNESDTLISLDIHITINIKAESSINKEKIIVLIPHTTYRILNYDNKILSNTILDTVKYNNELLYAPKFISSVGHYSVNYSFSS